MNRSRAAEAALGFNTIIWGATFVLVKAALADISLGPFYSGPAFLAARPVAGLPAVRLSGVGDRSAILAGGTRRGARGNFPVFRL